MCAFFVRAHAGPCHRAMSPILRRRRCDAEVATNCRNQNARRVSLAVPKVCVETRLAGSVVLVQQGLDPTMELLCIGRFQKWMLAMAVYGYARVSTRDQTLASQDAQLRAAGCAKIYAEKVSGAWSDRPELAKLLKRIDRGDVLIVTRLDRLARSIRDLLNVLAAVGRAGAAFKSLG